MGAIARGRTRVDGFPPGQDCRRSVELVRALGVDVQADGSTLTIDGADLHGLRPPTTDLDAGNSGTTARLASGLLAAQAFDTRLVGDESLSGRPFDRVVSPLTEMGAVLETTDGKLPMTIRGGQTLHGIDYELPVASAQVKSAVLLAGLYADGKTRVREQFASRNHTEIAFHGFGVDFEEDDRSVTVTGGSRLSAGEFRVPGDFSSAAFFITAAACIPGSELVVEDVGLNESRTALLNVLDDMGADIDVQPEAWSPGREAIGTVHVRGATLRGATVASKRLPAMIDEVPVLAVAATQAEGSTTVDGASELRVKESDRLAAIVGGLRALGADVEERDNGFTVTGGRKLRPATLQATGITAWSWLGPSPRYSLTETVQLIILTK